LNRKYDFKSTPKIKEALSVPSGMYLKAYHKI